MRKDEENYLKYLFKKYFEKSSTVKVGRNLLIFAWVIEIIVASIGFIAAILMTQQSQAEMQVAGVTGILSGFSAVDVQIGLVFFIAALAELTKIPFAIGVYNSGKPLFQGLGIIFLVLANFLTIETILTGMNQAFVKRTLVIQTMQMELEKTESLMREPTAKREKIIAKNLEKIKNFEIQKKRRSETDASIQAAYDQGLKSIREQSVNPSERKNLIEKIASLQANKASQEKQISQLRATNCKADTGISITKLLGGQSADCQQKANDKGIIQKNIDDIDNKLAALEEKKNILDIRSDNSNKDRTEFLRKDYEAKSKRNSDSLTIIDGSIQDLTESNQKLTADIRNKTDEYDTQENKVLTLRDKINQLAIQNTLYRVAMLFKPNEKNTIDENKSKYSIKAYYKITEEDLQRAFLYFFGVMGTIISILGTMLAFIALHLKDPQMAEARITRKEGPGGFKLLGIAFRRYIFALIKRLREPKIIEKKVLVDKEIEKIVYKDRVVEKEVERIVYKDRVVTEYQNVEVPVEVIRKELIHVPMYTNDKALLGSNDDNNHPDISQKDLDDFKKYKERKDKESNDNEDG